MAGILLVASKKAIARHLCKEDPPTQKNCLDIVEKLHDIEI